MHQTSSCISERVFLSCFKLYIFRHKFFSCAWICWNPRPRSCIGVSCSLIAISNASAWMDNFCCNSAVLRCSVRDTTNHERWCASVKVMLVSWIILFSLWSSSQGVSLGSIVISLNPIIDCVSDFGLLNYLFSTTWIYVIRTFGLSLECLMYHVSARYCKALTIVSFFMLSSVTPCASHVPFTMNQNWSGSSFHTPLNTVILLHRILNCVGCRGGVGGDGGDDGEICGSVGGGGMHGICFLIILIVLLGETFMSSSSLSHEGEIKGLVSNSLLLLFL